MGLLVLGDPLPWKHTRRLANFVKYHGIRQFINIWKKHRARECDRFTWGDEVECLLLYIDPKERRVSIQLRAEEILSALEQEQTQLDQTSFGKSWNVTFHPEYGNFMLEVTPAVPYGSYTHDLSNVEVNMRLRRSLLQSQLRRGEFVVMGCNFPLFGVPGYVHGNRHDHQPQPTTSEHLFDIPGPVLRSEFVPDDVMSPHPRFATLSGNIRRRRGKKVDIALPIFPDEKTDFTAFPDHHIHSDAMGFGMGCCCLQVTFQTRSNREARYLYDQLAVLAPIFLALTANTPFHRGYIVDTDARWDTICQSVDDRTDQERGLTKEQAIVLDVQHGYTNPYIPPTPTSSPTSHEQDIQSIPELNQTNPFLPYTSLPQAIETAQRTAHEDPIIAPVDVPQQVDWAWKGIDSVENNVGVGYNDITAGPNTFPRLTKSRYSSIDCYINDVPQNGYDNSYNDIPFLYHEPSYNLLHANGVDSMLSKHISSLFMRDPLVMFQGQINVDDTSETNHFESIQSTNWRSVRYKPPSHADSPGFRVEFRTMELQITDFENAAFTCIIALLCRAIVHFNLNLYIPLSKVDENFIFAHKNDASRSETFWFRHDIASTSTSTTAFRQMSMHEIMCGTSAAFATTSPSTTTTTTPQPPEEESFVGLLPIVEQYLKEINCDELTLNIMTNYINLLRFRASGQLLTGAQIQRAIIQNHPDYQHDSILPHTAVYDLQLLLHSMGNLLFTIDDLIGNLDPTTQSENNCIVKHCTLADLQSSSSSYSSIINPIVLQSQEHILSYGTDHAFPTPTELLTPGSQLQSPQPEQPQQQQQQLYPTIQSSCGGIIDILHGTEQQLHNPVQLCTFPSDTVAQPPLLTAPGLTLGASIDRDVVASYPAYGQESDSANSSGVLQPNPTSGDDVNVQSIQPIALPIPLPRTGSLQRHSSNSKLLLANRHTTLMSGSFDFTTAAGQQRLDAPVGILLQGSKCCDDKKTD